MKRRILSVLLTAAMIVTSISVPVYATETKIAEEVWTQAEELETEDETEQTVWIVKSETAEMMKESETVDETQEEVFSENISE